jgi:outer membrane receptor protein involved in Fe transport
MLRTWGTLVLFLLATPILALAQNTGRLSGVVTDASTGESLPGANVVLQGTQLGTATDVDGNYFIIGVPVGTYDITASFVGFQPQTIEDVEMNAGLTRELNFDLLPGAELDEIVVEYERPIIQRDAVGVPRVVSGEDLQNLPIRGVTEVAALQSGVVSQEGSDELYVRGGREEEVVYYVDGVRLRGSVATLGINQQAIADQEMLIGTIPARYGDAQAGIISITTKSGADQFFGSIEAITSEGLDGYGHNIGSLSLGGPLFSDRVGFFVSGQYTSMADANPYGIDTYQLNNAQLSSLRDNPQVVRISNAAGDEEYVPFPWAQAMAAHRNGEPLTTDSLGAIIDLPEGYSLGSGGLINAPDTYTADDFSLNASKDRPFNEMILNGNLTFDPAETITLRLGAGYESQREDELAYDELAYNPDVFYIDERDQWRVYGSLRQRFSQNFFYQIDAAYQDYYYTQRPNGFSSDVQDTFGYGDIASSYLETASRYFATRAGGTYEPLYTGDGLATVGRAVGTAFTMPGAPLSRYQKRDLESFQLSGNATSQIGLHQIEFGGEYRISTERWFYLNTAFGLARRHADGNCEQAPCVENYEDLPFDAFRERAEYWGYDFRGLNEVNDENIDAYFDRTEESPESTMNVAPYQPIYYAGYIQDKIEYRDLVLNLGVRVDVFDNNAKVLRDVYAPEPIIRANQIDDRPGGISSGDAVYFDDAGDVVGFRDLDGNFYDTEGSRVDAARIVDDLSGQVTSTDAPMSEAFEDYEPQVTFMPRIGVSFPVTDQAIFFASYNVTSQRPTEFEFTPFRDYEEITTQDSRTPNPKLEPEKTTQYELGFRQRLATNAALTISGFYRTQENKISNRRLIGGFPSYGTYLNADFTTTKGVEVGFDLRRTRNLALTANYTLAYAQGTGSDAASTRNIVWRGSVFPNTINPADFDQRHTVNASLDYRLAEGEGPIILGAPLLENVGVNVLAHYGSGQAYTALEEPLFSINDSFTSDAVGSINTARLPAISRLDLRVDRRFNLGAAGLTAYVSVINLLDTQNILAVYRATGLPDNDGYLASPGGRAFVDTQPDPESARFNYGAFIGGPINVDVARTHTSQSPLMYSMPRRVRLGMLFNF